MEIVRWATKASLLFFSVMWLSSYITTVFQPCKIYSVEWNAEMIMNGEEVRIRKKSIEAHLKYVLFCY
jgi:hypothetical protein